MPSTLQSLPTVQVFDYLYDPTTGLPVANANITVTWKQKLGSVTAPVVQAPPRAYQATTDVNGYWTIPALVPTDKLNPTNSVYTVSDGYNVYDINPITAGMPVGGWQALNIRVAPAPAVLQPAGQTVGPLTVNGLLQVNGPMGVTGLFTAANITMAALSATTGLFSGTLGVTGLATFNGGLTAVAPITLPAASLPESTITNLVADLAARPLDTLVVHLAGAEAITGAKTFSVEPVAPSFKATGIAALTNPASGRYIGDWTTVGAPAGGPFIVGDHGTDVSGTLWVCTTAGSPGTFKTAANVYKGQAYMAAATQVIANSTFTTLLLDTKNFDPNTNFDVVTNHTYTAPITAYYLIIGAVQLAATALRIGGRIFKNGATNLAETLQPGLAGSASIVMLTCIALLTAADTIVLQAYQESGGNLNANGGFPFTQLTVHYQSAA